MTDSARPADAVAESITAPDAPASGPSDDDARRRAIGAGLAHTVLEAAARRLAAAIAEFDAALDRRAPLLELQSLDRETAAATRDHALADRRFRAVTGRGDERRPDAPDAPRPGR